MTNLDALGIRHVRMPAYTGLVEQGTDPALSVKRGGDFYFKEKKGIYEKNSRTCNRNIINMRIGRECGGEEDRFIA